jgi:hypothetical protein
MGTSGEDDSAVGATMATEARTDPYDDDDGDGSNDDDTDDDDDGT